MWENIYLSFVLVTIISVEVDAQSTVDGSASCESSTFEEAVQVLRRDLVKHKEEIKTACTCGSNQHQISTPTVMP